MFANTKALAIPDGEVAQISCDGVVIWKGGYTNLVPLSTEADGKTIYNGGLGFKHSYRIRSGGAEAEYAGATCTGFIPIKANDVVRMSGCNALQLLNSNAINVYDKDHNVLGQITGGSSTYGYGFFQSTWRDYNWSNSKGVKENPTGVYVWTVPPDESIAYMRVTGHTGNDSSKMIVTVNEEIEL